MGSSSKMNVAVTGVGGGVGQSVIRALRLSTAPVRILGTDTDPWAVGLYQCDARELVPPVREAEDYAAALRRAVERHEIQALIPGTDTELLAIAALAPELSDLGCTAIVSIFASVNELRDGVPVKACPTLDSAILDFGRAVFEAFVQMGHTGPCNLQGRRTRDGIVLYELNPRFTGITAVRAAMGWNEVEAALRLFLRGEPAESVAARLSYDVDTVCLRYITEHFVERTAIEPSAGR